MSLTEQINEAIKVAMKAKDQGSLRGLRAIKSALLLAQTEKAGVEIDQVKEVQILQKLAKQRRDSMDIYQAQNRADLLAIEQEELKLIEQFLPAQMSELEITEKLKQLLQQENAKGPADLGRIMPLAIKAFQGEADNKTISVLLKDLLNKQA